MKRLLRSRYSELIAAILLLVLYGGFFTWLVPHLPHLPRATLHFDRTPTKLVFSPDSTVLAATHLTKDGEQCKLDLWDAETGAHRHRLVDGNRSWLPMEFSPGGTLLAARVDRKGLMVWDVRSGQPFDKLKGVRDATWFSPDWRFLLVFPEERSGRGSSFRILDPATGDQAQFPVEFGSTFPDWAIRFARDGKRFMVFQDSQEPERLLHTLKVQVWELGDGPRMRLLGKFKFVAREWDVSPNLDTLATVSSPPPNYDLRVQLWSLETGLERRIHLRTGDADVITHASFSPSGRFLTGDSDKQHYLWDAGADFALFRTCPADSWLSPSERWVVRRDSASFLVSDVKQIEKVVRIGCDADKANYVRDHWSPDGKHLLVTGLDAKRIVGPAEALLTGRWSKVNTTETYPVARLWDVERGEEIAAFRNCDKVLFSPDGRTLVVTVERDHSIRLYTVPPPRRVNLVITLTVITWTLAMLVGWTATYWRSRGVCSSTAPESQPSTPLPPRDQPLSA